MEAKERVTEQCGDEQTANALEFGDIAGTNNPYRANFTITTEAVAKKKNRRRKHNKKFMQNPLASGSCGRKSRAKTTCNRNNAKAKPYSQRRIEFEKTKKVLRATWRI